MRGEIVSKCNVCVALKAVENIPGDGWRRESETFVMGYMAGVVHSFDSGTNPEILGTLCIGNACDRHAVMMAKHFEMLRAKLNEAT